MDRKGTEPPMPAPRPEVADLLEVAVPPEAKVIAVSDLHLPPVRSAVSARSCETLARQLQAETGALTVVFAGDVVELLGIDGRGMQVAVSGLERLNDGNRVAVTR